MLEQAKVDPHAIDVVDVAQIAGIDDFLDFPHGSTVYEGVVDHQDSLCLLRRAHHGLGITDIGSEWLLDEHVFPGPQRLQSQRGVRAHGSRNRHRVDVISGPDRVRGI